MPAGQSVKALADQAVDAEQRDDMLEIDDGDADQAVKLAMGVDAKRPAPTTMASPRVKRSDLISMPPPAACISRKRSAQDFGARSLKPRNTASNSASSRRRSAKREIGADAPVSAASLRSPDDRAARFRDNAAREVRLLGL